MKASVMRGTDVPLSVEDVQVSEVGAEEVLIQTVAAGLCHSDLYHLRGTFDIPFPIVLGHESAGVVIDVGSRVDAVRPGDHVITCLSTFCGKCANCLAGRSYLCSGEHGLRREDEPPRLHQAGKEVHQFINVSSFAEQLLVHETAVVSIRRDMPLDLAALLGCGVSTGLGAVFNRAVVRPGDKVAVFGCGGIGLSAIQGARIAGASQVIAVDIQPAKLATASALGATDVVDASDGDPVAVLKDLSSGGVDHSIEAVGSAATCTSALECLAVGGTATVVGLMPAGRTFPVQARLLLDDRRLQGAYMGAQNFRIAMPKYVDMYMDGRLRLEEMVSSRIGLEGIEAAFESMEQGKSLRDLVCFDWRTS